jgi:hypothetical protein
MLRIRYNIFLSQQFNAKYFSVFQILLFLR